MSEVLRTVLLLALPASGKSEVRRYLASLSPATVRADFHMGPTVQIDDFPYVHLMRRIDDELALRGRPRVFFQAPDRSFKDPRDWGTLIQLLNEDYSDLVRVKRHEVPSASAFLFQRLEAASGKVGIAGRLANVDDATRRALADALEPEARAQLDDKNANVPTGLDGKTIVIEFARGGPDGSSLPLPEPFGYRYSLAQLSQEILETSSILYVWVTPEESRRKNAARTDPNDPGSILHHGVPLEVMLKDYGIDDMGWLEAQSGEPGAVHVRAHGRTFRLPAARFDNRVDKTSFIREDASKWARSDVDAVHQGLKKAFDDLIRG